MTLPCVSILKPEGDKVGELRVFIDVAPIYAEEPSDDRRLIQGGSRRSRSTGCR